MSITPGETVGPYRIIEQLGSGGMATVFKGYHPALDRYVAIKVLHQAIKQDEQFSERFKREARIVANLEHPHIIPIYDFNQYDNDSYLAMRFVEGDTLKTQIGDRLLSPQEILDLMRPVCQAVAYAHKQGVLHRDLKPSNIMVSSEGQVFVTDFGLARMVQDGETTLSQDMMIGTPQYISPEQVQPQEGRDLDERADIYSLGVILFEMLTGRVPFTADTPFATAFDHIYAPLPLPSTINPDIDQAVERLLLKALAKEPDERFAHVEEMLEALEYTVGQQIQDQDKATLALGTDTSLKGTALAQPARRTPWWIWAGGGVLALCVVVGLLAGLVALRRANRPPTAPVSEPAVAQPVDDPSVDSPPGPADDLPNDRPADQPLPQNNLPPQRPDPQAELQQAAQLARQAEQARRQGQLDEALELYQRAIASNPNFMPAYLGLAQLQQQNQDIEGMIQTLETAISHNPQVPELQIRLGEAYVLTDQSDKALATFEQAVETAPESANAYGGQALALLDLDRPDEAKQALDQALSLDETNTVARLAQAIYLYEQGNVQDAQQELRGLLQHRDLSRLDQVRIERIFEIITK